MAPEVTLRSYDSAVDVWAVGVLLYELLTGKAPFAAKTDGRGIKGSSGATFGSPKHLILKLKILSRRCW